jgi:drug/metabolite transporter (DMT)-like permease
MNKRLITLTAIVGLAALSRLLPHPPNVTPIAAMALFAGAHFRDRKVAFLLPIAAMFLSDLALGFAVYGATLLKSQPAVYLSMLITVVIGRLIRNKRSVSKIAAATFANAVIFYVVTNFSVWAGDPLYPKTWTGLIACYTAALPFFRNSLIGDFSFVAVLFGGFAALENFFISLREQQDPLSA